MIILITILALFTGFCLHVLWWQIAMPRNSTLALLNVFAWVLCMALIFMNDFAVILPFALLYLGCALVYIIMYSAIEQQSPTLSIVGLIYSAGHHGCDIQALKQQLKPDAQIKQRLNLIADSGMIMQRQGNWVLTFKGQNWARIFSLAAVVFGLERGG